MREPIIPQLEAEEFLMWETRQASKFELHHGFVIAFAGGTLDHDRISFNVRKALERLFPPPCNTFGSDVKVRYAPDSLFYADAGVVGPGFNTASMFVDSPRVVAEVLSPATRAYDLVEKRAAYRSMPSVERYVIVHTQARRLELDSRSPGDRWSTEVLDEGEAFLGIGVLSLDEVYYGSSLATAPPPGDS
jgi:Uma2 family endonuclease